MVVPYSAASAVTVGSGKVAIARFSLARAASASPMASARGMPGRSHRSGTAWRKNPSPGSDAQ